jgi:hypothetical protein
MCGGADSIEELFVVDNKDFVPAKAEPRRPGRKGTLDLFRRTLCKPRELIGVKGRWLALSTGLTVLSLFGSLPGKAQTAFAPLTNGKSAISG